MEEEREGEALGRHLLTYPNSKRPHADPAALQRQTIQTILSALSPKGKPGPVNLLRVGSCQPERTGVPASATRAD